MPGKVGSASFSVLLLDGYNLLAAKVKNFTHKIESVLERDDGLGDTFESMRPTGVKRAALTQDGAFFDDSTNGMHDALKAGAGTVARILSFAFAGNAIGRPFTGAQGVYNGDYEVLANFGNLTKANATYSVAGSIDQGVIVQNQTPKTADWNTKTLGTPVDTNTLPQRTIGITSSSVGNPTTITTDVPHGLVTGNVVVISGHTGSTPTINGERTVTVVNATQFTIPVNVTVGGTGGTLVVVNSLNGAVGYQQISAMTGFTGFVGKIRDSADDVTYADLIVFSNVAGAPAAERVTVAGTVDRYLSFDGDVTGTGSITPFAGLARL